MKKNTTKRALWMSALSLFLCFSMLVGTTFAWFTDTVETSMNTIVAGNLDVDVVTTADDVSIQDIETLFADILWEPGAVAYENLTVKNVGTLALKYQLSVNFANENTVNGYGLSDVLRVAVVDQTIDATASREAVLTLAGEGVLLTELVEAGTLEAGTAQNYAIIIWWEPSDKDNNWNVNNGAFVSDYDETENNNYLHIDLGVKLVATQLANEEDSFGPDYDEEAVYGNHYATDAATLADALSNAKDGDIVVLMNDIELNGNARTAADNFAFVVAKGTNVVLNLNGNSITKVSPVSDVNGDGKFTSADNQGVFQVKGNLTVVGEGVISMQNTGEDMSWNALSAVFSVEGGNLTLGEGVVVSHKGGTSMAYAVDVNTTGGETILNVDGATLYSAYTGVRVFNNHKTEKGIVNYNSGVISGVKRDIWAQIMSCPAENAVVNVADGITYTTDETGAIYHFTDVAVATDLASLNAALETGANILVIGDFQLTTSLNIENDATLNFINSDATFTIAEDACLTVANGANLTINNAVIATSNHNEDNAIVVDNGTLTLGEGTVIAADGMMPDSGWIRAYESNIVLDGAKIIGCDNNGKGTLINVAYGATLTINEGTVIEDNTITGSSSNRRYALIQVDGTLIMNGGKICNNAYGHKTLITVERDGKFVMNGGEITDNTYTGTGSAGLIMLFMNSSFEMNGGKIADNTLGTNSNSAAFYNLGAGCKVTINAGTVTNNTVGTADRFAYVKSAVTEVEVSADAVVSGTVSGYGINPVDVNTLK